MSKEKKMCHYFCIIIIIIITIIIIIKNYNINAVVVGSSSHSGSKETQTAVVWSCVPFIRSGQTHLARRSARGKKTRRAEEEVGRQHQGMDRPGVRQVSEGSGEQGKMEETGCEIICGSQSTLAVKG